MRNPWSYIAVVVTIAVSGPAAARDDTVIKLTSGDGARSVGIVSSSNDVEASGPAAITVGDDGTIYILDQNNARVLAVNGERAQDNPDVLPLPANVEPEDLAVVHNSLYLWSEGIVPVEKTEAAGGGGQTLRALDGGNADLYTRSVFASMGSVSPGPLTSIVNEIGRSARPDKRPAVTQYVPSRGLGDVVADIRFDAKDMAQILLRRSTSEENFLSLSLSADTPIGSIELLDIDTAGRPYILVELIGSPRKTGMMVVRYTPEGRIENVYDLAIDSDSVFSRRFVAIAPRGEVLFLNSQQTGVQVLKLAGRKPEKKLSVRIPLEPTREKRVIAGPQVAVLPKTRNDIIERAIGFEAVDWVVTPQSYGSASGPKCPNMNRIRRPLYLFGKLGETVTGMPYCWGCKTGVSDFITGVEKGVPAGNVCTKSPPLSNILGVDCSGFVSEAWGLKMHFATSDIPQIARRLPDPWSLQPGDALNKPGSHVVLVMRFTEDRKVEVMEASPNACKGRVCRNVYPLGNLLMRGFQPVRFRGVGS
ncbi:hypothetical protein [Rhizobium lusitanum]|uniref:TIGR02594 family protein n=1 Tax=Rhizobium lusitanum TaxID=293958 RepID=A0A7X0IUH2_9HYPH|nr:hypothetical protein [Rhizobium lusitanum]MBB6487064.1 hypothetical protein [Rhizobium lusitanum]